MKTWLYLKNPFLTAAKKTYAIALKISTYHDAQLLAHQSDPFFAGIYASYHPLHLAISTGYSNWKSQGGTQKSSTLTVNQLLDLVNKSRLNAWEYAILGVFQKGTPGYVALFPQGRAPFTKGSKESRIAAVKQLGVSLAGIAALATTKTDIDAFYAQLSTNRSMQLGHKGSTENKSDALDAAINVAMIDMFANFGLLIHQFKNDAASIESFFDLDTIRNHEQLIFQKTIAANSKRNIMKHTFAVTDVVKISNDGTVGIEVYLSNSADGDAFDNKIVLEPNASHTFPITDLGTVENKFLNVNNPNPNAGHCKIALV
jgi:hypothetical protein